MNIRDDVFELRSKILRPRTKGDVAETTACSRHNPLLRARIDASCTDRTLANCNLGPFKSSVHQDLFPLPCTIHSNLKVTVRAIALAQNAI